MRILVNLVLVLIPLLVSIVGILKMVNVVDWNPIGDFLVIGTIICLSGLLFIKREALFFQRLILTLFAIGWLGFKETTFNKYSIEKDVQSIQVPEVGSLAPELKIHHINQPASKPVEYDFSEHTHTMINFWASWCNPCIKEMPIIDSFYRVNKHREIEVIGITQLTPNAGGANKLSQTLERELSILQLLDISYPVFIDKSGLAVQSYGVEALPISFLVDSLGKVSIVGEGTSGTMELLKWLEENKEK